MKVMLIGVIALFAAILAANYLPVAFAWLLEISPVLGVLSIPAFVIVITLINAYQNKGMW